MRSCWWGSKRLSAKILAPHQIFAPPPASASGRAAISSATVVRRRKEGGMAVAHLLELLDGTLVDTTALVDQVCDGL